MRFLAEAECVDEYCWAARLECLFEGRGLFSDHSAPPVYLGRENSWSGGTTVGRARDRCGLPWPCDEATGLPRFGRAEALDTLEIGGDAGVAGTSPTAAFGSAVVCVFCWMLGVGGTEGWTGSRTTPENFCLVVGRRGAESAAVNTRVPPTLAHGGARNESEDRGG